MGFNNNIPINDNLQVYTDNIYIYADEYINNLNDINDIYNSSIFNGMIKYIYKHVFKPNPKDKDKYRFPNTKLNTDNIDLLNDIWDIYTGLCYKYKKKPSILNFSMLTGIDKGTFNKWNMGKARNTSDSHGVSVKRWLEECESSLLDGAMENNSIGCIFALKANYGYREAAQQIEVVNSQTPDATALDIASRRALENAQLPELPELE